LQWLHLDSATSSKFILWHDAWKLEYDHLLGNASLSTFAWQREIDRCWATIWWTRIPVAIDVQITTDKTFKCVFCLRSAPGHKRICNSFAEGERRRTVSKKYEGERGVPPTKPPELQRKRQRRPKCRPPSTSSPSKEVVTQNLFAPLWQRPWTSTFPVLSYAGHRWLWSVRSWLPPMSASPPISPPPWRVPHVIG
jgi:hypothetical protein